MFKVGDTIVYSDGKIYKITEKIEKDYGRGLQLYFVLKQNELYKEERNTAVFAPFDKVQLESRELMSKKEVNHLIDSFPEITPIWINDYKQRKIVFSEMAASKDPKNIATVVKSFYVRDQELKDTNKSLTITDKKMMDKLKSDLFIELSLVLNCDFDGVVKYIDKRLKR